MRCRCEYYIHMTLESFNINMRYSENTLSREFLFQYKHPPFQREIIRINPLDTANVINLTK